MIDCYKIFNPYKERLLSYKIEGVNGEKDIKKLMAYNNIMLYNIYFFICKIIYY